MSIGTKSSNQRSSTTPLFGAGTGRSRVEQVSPNTRFQGGLADGVRGFGGSKRVILDPTIYGIQDQGIDSVGAGRQSLGEAVGRFGGSLGELKSQLFTNQDPFTQARVAPTEERFGRERGALTQDVDRRGLGGSSFGQQALTSQATEQTRELGNQRALAVQESINTGLTVDQMLLESATLEAQGRLEEANYLRGVAADRAQTEVSLLTATGSDSRGQSSGVNVGFSMGGGN